MRISRSFTDGPRLHTLHASVRARRLDNRYGGAAGSIDLGERRLGERIQTPAPDPFSFGERMLDHVRQTTIGLAYEGRWKDLVELSPGIQRADCRKTIDLPGDLPDIRASY